MATIHDFGFYTINPDYLEYLNSVDSEVYYSPSYRNSTKPFIGIIVLINSIDYFIPLTSAKPKHLKWKNVSDQHVIIYEIVDTDGIKPGSLFKKHSKTQSIHLLALLDFKKMIPVPKECYSRINYANLHDDKYVALLKKEYAFCLSIESKILEKVSELYRAQIETGVVRRANCNFQRLELALLDWQVQQTGPVDKLAFKTEQNITYEDTCSYQNPSDNTLE